MTDMYLTMSQYLQNHASEILAEARCAMARAHLKNYEKIGDEQTQQRLQALYDLMTRCILERNLTPMRAQAKIIANERFAAGFDLGEVQTAFNVLEEAVWMRLMKEIPPPHLAEALGLVSTVLGAGKDNLARTYVGLASRTHAPSLNMSDLFAGTEG
ncbi:hypothetical protein KJ068_30380 [bacterium]|nr:hypothetical protein [bacterium]